ncbi:hypothetical protein COLO4_26446 [Corchorus olitorius]|uniref:Uncharacterized protein n=1 Tax=Corchorus olitorius TaxID=93759 RepID=A0A1R3HX67_9ROSI|nr:hypothetical protein COLO4_26446 [Corchorus olitorius]
MSMPPLVQQPPPGVPVTQVQQPYESHAAHASIGPVIAVLVVIVILGILAGMIGRLCTGRKIMGYGQYDIESWFETKFSSCIDGRIYSPPPPRPNVAASANNSVPASIQHQPPQEGPSPSPQTSSTPNV